MSSPYGQASATGNTSATPLSNEPSWDVTSLRELNEDIAENLLKKKDLAINKIRSKIAGSKFKTGMYNVSDTTYLVVPESWFSEDDILGQMIVDLTKISGIHLKVCDEKSTRTEYYNEEFILGLWFGIYNTTIQKLSRTKESYERGRTCSYALIVKKYFATDDRLGPEALKYDNYYFGNHPGEVGKNGDPVPFYAKDTLESYFTDEAFGNTVFAFISTVVAKVQTSYLTDSTFDMVAAHIVPYATLLRSCYPKVTVKGKKGNELQIRKPNPIKSSPLFLREEMKLISEVTSARFLDLGVVESDYLSQVQRRGFNSTFDTIKRSMTLRLEMLMRFANRTKIRLQEIRQNTKDVKKRKAQVIKSEVEALVQTYREADRNLFSDIIYIVGKSNLRSILSRAYGKKLSDLNEAEAFLFVKCVKVYSDLQYTNLSSGSQPSIADPEDIDFGGMVKHIVKVESVTNHLIQNMKGVAKCSIGQLLGRTNQLKGLVSNTIEAIKAIEGADQSHLANVLKYVLHDESKRPDVWLTAIIEAMKDQREVTLKVIQVELKSGASQHRVAALTDFKKAIELLQL